MLSNTHYQPQQALKSISANVQQEPPLLSTLLADLERTQPLQKVTNMLLPASGYIQQQRSAGGARPAQHNWQQGDRQQHQYRQRQQNGKQQQQQSGEQQWPYRQRTDQKRQHSQQSPLGQLQPNIQPQPQQKWPYRQQQQQQQQRDTQQQQLPAITAVPGSRVGRLNMLIDLGAKLYLSTVPLLPQARRPHQPTVSKHVAAIGRLAIPFVEHPTPRQQVYMSLQEAAVLAKIVDVVYILLEINKYRNRQRTEEAMAVLRDAGHMLTLPSTTGVMTAMENPHLKCAHFARATNSMRFHIVCALLDTYVGVLSISEAVWRWQRFALDAMRDEDLLKMYGACLEDKEDKAE